jgi:Flp pilus assembly protein TadG
MRSRFVRELDAGPIVEFAIIAPVLVLMLIGVIELAWAFNTRNTYVTAVREGARFAAVQVAPTTNNPCTDHLAAIRTVVRSRITAGVDVVPDGNITCTFSGGNVTVRIVNQAYVSRTRVSLPRFLSRAITLNATATFRWERSS